MFMAGPLLLIPIQDPAAAMLMLTEMWMLTDMQSDCTHSVMAPTTAHIGGVCASVHG